MKITTWGFYRDCVVRQFVQVSKKRAAFFLWVIIHALISMKTKAVRSFETSGTDYPETQRNNLEALPQYENSFANNKIF
jgi:hypothetical protein